MAELLLRWVIRWLLRHRPALGWGTVLWTVLGVVTLAGSLHDAVWLRHGPPWWPAAVLSTGLALWLGTHWRRRWLIFATMTVAGLVVATMTAAQAWPPFAIWWGNGRHLWWLIFDPSALELPFIPLGPWWWERMQGLWLDVAAWLHLIPGAAPLFTSDILVLAFESLLWAAGSWAGWIVVQQRRALWALLPAGVLLAANVFFADAGYPWLWVLMSALLLLSARLQQYKRESLWEQQAIDYSPEYRLELYLALGFITMGIMALMLVTPNVRVRAASDAFWTIFEAPTFSFARGGDSLLDDIDRAPGQLVGGGDVAGGSLPRQHLLGNHPELGQQLIMRVQLVTPLPSALAGHLRWRAITFNTYNGRGWQNPPETGVQRFAAGALWEDQPAGPHVLVEQHFRFQHTPYWLYALAEPQTVDRPYRVHWRTDGDPIGLDIRQKEYTVISAIPAASEAELRASPPPDSELLAPYLQLPDAVPARVGELAREISRGQETAYDQARAIERYLRSYRYTLDLPPPPADRDVVDWFLFDLQQGYCDYYATSMVVLARSLGIPARLAVGYAPGDFDAEHEQWTVSEASAHSWPELYFSGVGWIPFEPTAAQEVFVWQAPPPQELTGPQTIDAETLERLRRWRWWRYGAWRWPAALLGVLLLGLLGRRALAAWRLRRAAGHIWQLGYWHLVSWGRRWGLAIAEGATPRQVLALWQQALPPDSPQARQTLALMQDFIAALESRAFAPPAAQPSPAVGRRQWRQLRRQLWRLSWQRRRRRLWR